MRRALSFVLSLIFFVPSFAQQRDERFEDLFKLRLAARLANLTLEKAASETGFRKSIPRDFSGRCEDYNESKLQSLCQSLDKRRGEFRIKTREDFQKALQQFSAFCLETYTRHILVDNPASKELQKDLATQLSKATEPFLADPSVQIPAAKPENNGSFVGKKRLKDSLPADPPSSLMDKDDWKERGPSLARYKNIAELIDLWKKDTSLALSIENRAFSLAQGSIKEAMEYLRYFDSSSVIYYSPKNYQIVEKYIGKQRSNKLILWAGVFFAACLVFFGIWLFGLKEKNREAVHPTESLTIELNELGIQEEPLTSDQSGEIAEELAKEKSQIEYQKTLLDLRSHLLKEWTAVQTSKDSNQTIHFYCKLEEERWKEYPELEIEISDYRQIAEDVILKWIGQLQSANNSIVLKKLITSYPDLFFAESVRAWLNGRPTETRKYASLPHPNGFFYHSSLNKAKEDLDSYFEIIIPNQENYSKATFELISKPEIILSLLKEKSFFEKACIFPDETIKDITGLITITPGELVFNHVNRRWVIPPNGKAIIEFIRKT